MKNKLKVLFIVCACIYSNQSFPQLSTFSKSMRHPESIISDGKYFYVSDIGNELNALSKDGDGAIWKLSLDGKIIESYASKETLNAPKGTAIINGTLYIADLDRIVGISCTTGERIVIIDFSSFGLKLLNDIAVRDDSTLFVSSTDLNKIFQVSLGKKHNIKALKISEIKGANGIYYDNRSKRLYYVGLGSFTSTKGIGETGYIGFKKNKTVIVKIKNLNGFFDGIALIDSNTLIVSDWVSLSKAQGVLKKINLLTNQVTTITPYSIGGPADFYFDKNANQLLIPETQQGKLLRLVFKESRLNSQ